jgi:hypothetical protein
VVFDRSRSQCHSLGDRLTQLGLDVADVANELREFVPIPRQMDPFGRRRLFNKAHIRPPFGNGANRPSDETAAAIRTYVEQHAFNAMRAERTFVCANERIGRLRRKILVAVFAIWSELKHRLFGRSASNADLAALPHWIHFAVATVAASAKIVNFRWLKIYVLVSAGTVPATMDKMRRTSSRPAKMHSASSESETI